MKNDIVVVDECCISRLFSKASPHVTTRDQKPRLMFKGHSLNRTYILHFEHKIKYEGPKQQVEVQVHVQRQVERLGT